MYSGVKEARGVDVGSARGEMGQASVKGRRMKDLGKTEDERTESWLE